MKAKLVTFDICTRVIVPDEASEEQVLNAAIKRLLEMKTDLKEKLESGCINIEDDKSVPYDPQDDREDP